MTYDVSENELHAFERDGAVPLRNVVGQQDLEQLAIAIEDDIREPGPFYHGYDSDEGRFQSEVFGKTDAVSQYERNPDFEDIPDIESDRSGYDIISWDLQPGDPLDSDRYPVVLTA